MAAAALARAQRLRAAGVDSDADVETAKAAAAAESDAARSLNARAGGGLTLRAPVAGVVEDLSLSPGDVVAQGATVAKVGAMNGVRVRLGLEAAGGGRRHPRRGGQASSPLAGGGERAGLVVSVNPQLDAQTRLASLFVRVPAGGLAPGEPLKGVVLLKEHVSVLAVPRQALLYDGDQPYVFAATAGVAHRRDITLGVADGDRVEVLKGLAAGDRVVVDGASALDDGMAVREAKAAASPTS